MVWFLGIVEDLEDPHKLGRVRIRMFGEPNDQLEKEDLRWATPVVPMTSASLAGVGASPTGIDVGSYAVGFYLDGRERQRPMVIGTFPKIPEMDDSKHDVSSLARGENSIEKKKLGPEPKTAYKAEYPHNKTITTKSGHAIEIDDTPGAERLHIYHKSGSYEEINHEGRRVTKTVKDNYIIVGGDDTIYIKGKAKITVDGDVTMSVKGDVELTAKKNAKITATKTVAVKAKKITLN